MCGNGFLQESEAGFSKPGADFENRVIRKGDDVGSAVAEVGEGHEIHGVVIQEIHVDDEKRRWIGGADLPGLGKG